MGVTADFTEVCDTERLDELGTQLYGEQWPNVRAHNVKRMKGDDTSPLGYDECQLLINGLLRLKEGRRNG